MMKTLKEYTHANRQAWNSIMPSHQQVNSERLDREFTQPGHQVFEAEEYAQLMSLGIKGKNVAHLCCNNGIELMSFKNLGAQTCVGFDICDLAIDEARERAKKTGIDCQFVCTDVFDISDEYKNRFDIIYISSGALGWIPDINLFFAKAQSLLTRHGHLFIHLFTKSILSVRCYRRIMMWKPIRY